LKKKRFDAIIDKGLLMIALRTGWRGNGVRLQKYKDGGIKDARLFSLDEGLTWQNTAGRTHARTKNELKE
jgi:hypothetical protein